ncbi:Chlorophyll A-B binding family protein [Perilla frutescens var. frutescens]|nr:Chlorophyll A-B binding family protein [Perilla frutescens var. frutescens]
MAAASCYGMPVISSVRRGGSNKLFGASNYVLPLNRDAKFRVRSLAEDNETKEPEPTPTVAPPKPNPSKPKVSTSFSDVLAFSGPAPERINGRLAMTGFAAAIGVELASGQDLFSQLSNGGVPWFVFTSVLLSVASLVPLFSGQTPESKSGTVMSSDAELWNGRFAMLGLMALALTEYLKGSAIVSM